MTMTWHHCQFFFWRCFVFLVIFSYWLNFMSISWLFLELWQFTFKRDWPEIRKSEIPPSEFRPLSGDWVESEMANLAWMSLTKFYWMLLVLSYLLRQKQKGGELLPPLPPTQIIVKILSSDPVKISQNCFYSFNCSNQIDIHILKFPFPLDK